jgi:hypothetical protein
LRLQRTQPASPGILSAPRALSATRRSGKPPLERVSSLDRLPARSGRAQLRRTGGDAVPKRSRRLRPKSRPPGVCEHLFVTSQGSPCDRLRLALDSGNPTIAIGRRRRHAERGAYRGFGALPAAPRRAPERLGRAAPLTWPVLPRSQGRFQPSLVTGARPEPTSFRCASIHPPCARLRWTCDASPTLVGGARALRVVARRGVLDRDFLALRDGTVVQLGGQRRAGTLCLTKRPVLDEDYA